MNELKNMNECCHLHYHYHHYYLIVLQYFSPRTNWCQTNRHHIVPPCVHFALLTPGTRLRPHSTQAPPACTHKATFPTTANDIRVVSSKTPCTETARGNHTHASTARKLRTKGSLGMETHARCRPPVVPSGQKGGGGTTTSTEPNVTSVNLIKLSLNF